MIREVIYVGQIEEGEDAGQLARGCNVQLWAAARDRRYLLAKV